jgi:hypothetical protein
VKVVKVVQQHCWLAKYLFKIVETGPLFHDKPLTNQPYCQKKPFAIDFTQTNFPGGSQTKVPDKLLIN